MTCYKYSKMVPQHWQDPINQETINDILKKTNMHKGGSIQSSLRSFLDLLIFLKGKISFVVPPAGMEIRSLCHSLSRPRIQQKIPISSLWKPRDSFHMKSSSRFGFSMRRQRSREANLGCVFLSLLKGQFRELQQNNIPYCSCN